jgi:Helix-turn-helix domain of transposase family ISL3
MEKLPEVNEKRWMTNRLIEYIGKQSLSRTFTSIADDVGVAEGTVRGIFRNSGGNPRYFNAEMKAAPLLSVV